jgi:hypothetical protein
MDYPFDHADFAGRTLALRVSNWFVPARLVVDGHEVRATRRKFVVRDNQGRPREFVLKGSFLDPVPKLLLDGTTIEVASPLQWYEYAWTSLPILLALAGGALGGLLGAIAAFSNVQIFRGNRSTAAKYLLAGLLSAGSVSAYVVGAIGLQMAIVSIAPGSGLSLDMIAQASNAELPMMIDEQTELVRVEGLDGVLVHHLRLKQVGAGRISGEILAARMRPAISAKACADSESRERFLENGVILRYAYAERDGTPIAEVEVSAEDCN